MKVLFFCILTVILMAGTAAQTPGGFARRYSAPPEYNGWRGQVDFIPNTTNYLLTAYSVVTNQATAQSILSLARLQSDGAVDWALSATQGARGTLTLRPLADQPLVYAKLEGLPEEDFWTVFGLFNARDGSRVFERGIPVIVDQSEPGSYYPETSPRVETLTDGRSTVVLAGGGQPLHVAVLDQTGAPQWERSFSSSAFGAGVSQLIEYPGRGFWLVVQGPRVISTDPNPPAVNTALTLSLVRLSAKGEVMWTSKLAGLLTSTPRLSVGPVAIGADGTLVLPLTDTVINTWGSPTLLDVVTYLLVVAPDGTLRWTRRIPGVTLPTPLLSPAAGSPTLLLFGQKLVSPTAIVGDSVMLRLDLSTGALVAQTSVSHSAAYYVTPVGITQNQVFFQATTPPGAAGTRALIGSMNLNLGAAVWKQFDLHSSPTAAALAFNPKSGTLVFSDTSTSRVEVITLGINLLPLVSTQGTDSTCTFFSDAAVPLANPDVRIETIILTPSFLSMSVADTDIPLLPSTRIELHPIHPQAEDLCPAAGSGLNGLVLQGDAKGELTLSFPSEIGKQYELLFAPSVAQPFQSVETIAGDGNRVSRAIGTPKDHNGFFSVRTVAP